MSLEREALACILPGFEGPVAPDWVRRRLAEGLGGVVLFGWNVESPDAAALADGGRCAPRASCSSGSTRRAAT